MKIKKKTKIISLTVVGVLAIAGIGYYATNQFSSSNDGSTIYVQKVSSLTGSSYTSNRFSGVVESQETLDINSDASKKVTEIYVQAGQEVHQGDSLFTYDVSEASTSIDQKRLDIEAQNNEIVAQQNIITDYNESMKTADADQKVEIQAQINNANFAIRQAQNTIKSTQTEIDQLNKQIENATVTSTIDGIIKEVNPDGGYDSMGNQKPFISITQTGEYRVKGTLSEMGMISEGSSVIVRSRLNEDQMWKGTVTNVDTEPQTNTSSVYYGSDSGESASKYPFYVTLENNDGLMLGQHVFIELDDGQTATKSGLWLDDSFIAYDEEGNPFVWVSENNKLKKRSIELGESDPDMFQTEIVSGLSNDDYIAWNDDTYQEGMKTTSDEEITGE